jgi:hypothetical protein
MRFLSSGDGLGGSSARRASDAGATRPRAPCVFAAAAAAGAPTPAASGGTAGALTPAAGGGAAGAPTSVAGGGAARRAPCGFAAVVAEAREQDGAQKHYSYARA